MKSTMTSAKILSRVASRIRRRESGQELLEFGLLIAVLVPLLLGTFVTGLSLVRSIQTNQMDRDLADMYIHGADFSTYPMQQVAQRLARGLNLQIGSSFTGNQKLNTGNGGDGLVTVSQVMWVGTTTESNCVAVGAANCTNHDKFVFTERIQFGNGTLSSQVPSSLGSPGAGASHFFRRHRAELREGLQCRAAGLRPDEDAESLAGFRGRPHSSRRRTGRVCG